MLAKAFTNIAGLISILAGIYLASTQAAGSNSLMQTLINGIGWYCIARGIFMMSSTATLTNIAAAQTDQSDNTQQCRHCMSMVHKFASKCSHCGSDLSHH